RGETWEWDGTGKPAWVNYGQGWPGTNGIPSFTAASEPDLCTPITLDLANSLGADTTGAVVLNVLPTDQVTDRDGHLLVFPAIVIPITLPANGVTFNGIAPCDRVFCGRSIYLQAIELDSGASRGISFTPGLKLGLAP